MNENEKTKLKGSFVESAFTADEVDSAIAEEAALGIDDAPCAFVGDVAGIK